MSEIQIDTRRLGDRLAKIQDSLPRGYKVTLLVRNPSNPKGHVLLTDDREEDILRAITEELHTADTKIQEPVR